MGAQTPPGGLTSDNPFKTSAERSPFFWSGLANSYQNKLNARRKDTLGTSTSQKSLVTGGEKLSGGNASEGRSARKRIYGLGKAPRQQPSGTVTKPKLGGN